MNHNSLATTRSRLAAGELMFLGNFVVTERLASPVITETIPLDTLCLDQAIDKEALDRLAKTYEESAITIGDAFDKETGTARKIPNIHGFYVDSSAFRERHQQ